MRMRVAGLTLGVAVVVGARAVGQPASTGMPYRITTIDRGSRVQGPGMTDHTAWDGGLAVQYRTAAGVVIGRYDPVTRVMEEVVRYPRRDTRIPRILGEVGGRLLYTDYEPLEGTIVWSVTRSGVVERLGVAAARSETVRVSVRGETSMILSIGGSGEGELLWRTDGTAAGTCVRRDYYGGAKAIAGNRHLGGLRYDLALIDLCTGEHQTVLSNSGYVWGVSEAVGGEHVVLLPDGVWRTDGTPNGTRKIVTADPSVWSHRTFLDGAVVFMRGGAVRSIDTRTGEESVLLAAEDGGSSVEHVVRVNGRVVLAGCDGARCRLWTTDGTIGGTRSVLDIPGRYYAFVSDESAAMIEASPPEMGYSGVYRTDGIDCQRTQGTWRDSAAVMVGGRAYFSKYRFDERGITISAPWMIDERGEEVGLGDFEYTMPIGAIGVRGGGLLGSRAFLYEWPQGQANTRLWSTSGDVGDWASVTPGIVPELPVGFTSDGTGRGMWGIDPYSQRGRLYMVRDSGLEVLADWPRPEGWWYDVEEAKGGRIVALNRGMIVQSDGTRAGTRWSTLIEPAMLPRFSDPVITWCDGWTAVTAATYDDAFRRKTSVWRVDGERPELLGELSERTRVMGIQGRLYVETRAGWDHGAWTVFEPGVRPTVVRFGQLPGDLIGERDGWVYFNRLEYPTGMTIRRARVTDRNLAQIDVVGRTEVYSRTVTMLGGRIVIPRYERRDFMLSMDLATGVVEELPMRSAWLDPAMIVNGRAVGEDVSGLWVTDGTAAGTRPVPVRDGLESSYHAMVNLGDRLILSADTPAEGHQIFAVNLCAADHTGDGVLDGEDVAGFLAAFESGEGPADMDGDGFIGFFDYLLFLQAFEAGC